MSGFDTPGGLAMADLILFAVNPDLFLLIRCIHGSCWTAHVSFPSLRVCERKLMIKNETNKTRASPLFAKCNFPNHRKSFHRFNWTENLATHNVNTEWETNGCAKYSTDQNPIDCDGFEMELVGFSIDVCDFQRERNTSVRLEPLTETKAMRSTPCRSQVPFVLFRLLAIRRAKSINKRGERAKEPSWNSLNHSNRRRRTVCVRERRVPIETLSASRSARHTEIRIGKRWHGWSWCSERVLAYQLSKVVFDAPSCRMVVAFGCLFLVSKAMLVGTAPLHRKAHSAPYYHELQLRLSTGWLCFIIFFIRYGS